MVAQAGMRTVTTPLGLKPRGFSRNVSLLKAPSEPCNPLQPPQAAMKHSKDLAYRLAQNGWDVTTFTHGNDLPWNLQIVFFVFVCEWTTEVV